MLRRGIARNALLAIALFTSACGDDAERPAPGPAPEVPGDLVEVTRVVDGDTIRVLLDGYEERVRYIGVNTPEVRDPFGDEATRANRRLVEGRRVRLTYDVDRRDRHGRLLAYVHLEDGTFVNAKLVEDGFAQVMTVPPNVAHQEDFLRLQREARAAARGLWASPAR